MCFQRVETRQCISYKMDVTDSWNTHAADTLQATDRVLWLVCLGFSKGFFFDEIWLLRHVFAFMDSRVALVPLPRSYDEKLSEVGHFGKTRL